MKTIVAGSRTVTDIRHVNEAIHNCGFEEEITEVVSGGAKGVDALGEEWARTRNIPIKVFPADWAKYGNRAGPIRNCQMGDYADALVAVWDGKSSGTKHMIDYARSNGLVVYVHIVKEDDKWQQLTISLETASKQK